MNKEQYLKSYWRYPNEQEAILLKFIAGLDIADRINQTYDRFRKTDSYLSHSEVARLHRFIEKEKFPEAIYFKTRRKIKRRDAVNCYLIAELLSMYEVIKAKATTIFTRIAAEKYRFFANSAIDFDIEPLMNRPMASGKLLDVEFLANARYRAKQLTDHFTMQMNYGEDVSASDNQVVDIIRSDKNSLLKATTDGFRGLLDEYMTNIIGYSILKAFINGGVEIVEFISVIDKKTTRRCSELDGTRWRIDQLQLGYNLPPITINSIPHPCRSVLRVVKRSD